MAATGFVTVPSTRDYLEEMSSQIIFQGGGQLSNANEMAPYIDPSSAPPRGAR